MLNSFQTLTGIKFLAVSTKGSLSAPEFIKSVYSAYTDYVMKVSSILN